MTTCRSRLSTCRAPSTKCWRKPKPCAKREQIGLSMADTFELEIATPERELVREDVTEAQIPGKDGFLGILPGHAPLLGLLGVGPLSYMSGGRKRYMAIHGGFLEVLPDHVRVLADRAERAE